MEPPKDIRYNDLIEKYEISLGKNFNKKIQ